MKYIAILRGINVGGHRKIIMNDLIKLLSGDMISNLKTYIQSGNLIFESSNSVIEIERYIEEKISLKYGFDVPTIVRKKEDWLKAIQENPFENEPIEHLHITFFKEEINSDKLDEINQLDTSPDQMTSKKNHAYLCLHTKYHQTKLSNQFFEKKLNTSCSTRNWKTILKLKNMVE